MRVDARSKLPAVRKLSRTRAAGLLAVALAVGATSQSALAWTSTASHGFPLKTSFASSPLPASKVLNIVVSLKLQQTAQLKQFLEEQARPGSLQYGQKLTPAQFAASYAPSDTQAQAVVAYLNKCGLTNVQLLPGGTLIRASGTAAVIEAAFNTKLVQFLSGGSQHVVNLTDVSVPDAFAGTVLSVVGLNDLAVAKTSLAKKKSASLSLPALNLSYDAAQFQTVYDAGSTPTGGNTVLAIISGGDDLSQVVSDLRQYEAEYGLPQVPVRIVNVETPGTDTSGDDEWDLDSQSSSGIAGNLKQLVFYNTGSLASADLLLAFNAFTAEDSAQIGNMSFGGCEALDELAGSTAASDQAYMQAVAQGQTFFASAGDAGAACTVEVNLGLPDAGLIDVEYPASSPYVVAVGGTTLTSDSNYNYVAEISWDAGGGGTSLFETAPSWQQSVVSLATLGLRAVPDIAMDADPNTGAELIVDGAATTIGGTSLSSPLSAGVWARVESAHCNQYGFAAPMIYALHTANGLLSTATGFHDVIVGTNGLFVATPGWDYTTGFGSFDISAFNQALPAVSCS
jgi:subtilase family serine protease